MAELPDELWTRILEMGVSASNPSPKPSRLTFMDLCCISISCRRFRRLVDDSLWLCLLSSDFPSPSDTSLSNSASSSSIKSCKLLYQARYEKDKARRIAAHRRAVLRIEGKIAEHTTRLQDLQVRRAKEGDKIKAVASELSNLQKIRQASMALNVWQPEVIRGRQKQLVEQCSVPVESRIDALEMELKLCKHQILVLEKGYRDEKQRLEAAKDQLSSVIYHPLQNFPLSEQRVDLNFKRTRLRRDTNEGGTSKML